MDRQSGWDIVSLFGDIETQVGMIAYLNIHSASALFCLEWRNVKVMAIMDYAHSQGSIALTVCIHFLAGLQTNSSV
jgi:hypothetical protein